MGRLTEKQQQKFIDHAIRVAVMLEQVRVVCMKCGREIKQTTLGKLWHWIVCWD